MIRLLKIYSVESLDCPKENKSMPVEFCDGCKCNLGKDGELRRCSY